MDSVGSSAVLVAVSLGVGFIPVVLNTPIPQRTAPALNVTTISPVVPVGTLATARAEIERLLDVFLDTATRVAVTPPIVTESRVGAPTALAVTPTIMYLLAAAVLRFCVENV